MGKKQIPWTYHNYYSPTLREISSIKMVKNLELTQPIATEGDCPSLESSRSGGESATPSPSSSFSHHGTPMDSPVAWYHDLSQRSPVSLHQFDVPSPSVHDSMMPHMSLLMPTANFPCTNMLDGMPFFGEGTDLTDCHQILIGNGLPAAELELDGTDYRLAAYEYAFQPDMPLSIEMASLPRSHPAAEGNDCFPHQMFNAEGRPGCLPCPEDGPYLTASMDSLPQTVVPSQTITEPMTPCSGRGRSLRSPLDTASPMEILMENEALMTPSPAHSPVGDVNTRLSALTLSGRLTASGRTPCGRPRSLRTIKRGSAEVRKTLEERTPLIIESKVHHCTHPDCNKAGDKRKSFGRREHLKRHEKSVHSGERPFECFYCKKRFSRSDNFSSHRETHSRPRGKNRRNDFFEEEAIWHRERERSRRLKLARRKLSLD